MNLELSAVPLVWLRVVMGTCVIVLRVTVPLPNRIPGPFPVANFLLSFSKVASPAESCCTTSSRGRKDTLPRCNVLNTDVFFQLFPLAPPPPGLIPNDSRK